MKAVILHDHRPTRPRDLGANFYLTAADVGKNRAEACRARLAELNAAVAVTALATEGPLQPEQLLSIAEPAAVDVVVLTESSTADAIRLDEACRARKKGDGEASPIAFLRADVRGVFASVFADFGDSFVVDDVDGEEPATGIVAGITPCETGGGGDGGEGSKNTLVTCVDDERLEFDDGMRVSFSELVGADELMLPPSSSSSPEGHHHQNKSFLIANCKPTSFEVVGVDCAAFERAYERGGVVTQVKQPKTLSFAPLAAALEHPVDASKGSEFLVSDFSKFDRPPLLHLGFSALDAFEVETGRCPKPWDEADAERLCEIASALNETAKNSTTTSASSSSRYIADLDLSSSSTSDARKVLSALSFTASAELSPLAAVFGGVVGQEVVKAASGKFHPLHQFFYFDALEVLPETKPADVDGVATPSRYESQVSVFGRSFQEKLSKQRVFLVGAGALGCEFLKAFALMGVGTGDAGVDGTVVSSENSSSSSSSVGGSVKDNDPPSSTRGLVTVTDDDTIEKSNLSRQFLFRDWDIGQAKSTAAARAALAINPSLRVRALQNRVSPDTEKDVFDDAFWDSLSLVVNALDNVTARLYVDSRCVYFGKPLLESGTLGPKCNTQAVIPGLTENYGASRDPPEKQAPMCTVHSFPHTIDHCLTWARSEFEGCLERGPSEANAALADPQAWASAARAAGDAAAREQAFAVAAALGDDAVADWGGCVRWARLRFQELFHDRVAQLVHTFPEDAVTSTGARFWSAPKRFPTPLVFDAADAAHASLVQAAAVLKAQAYGIKDVPPEALDLTPAGAAFVASQAAKVEVPAFVPKEGVKIETDPKADGGGGNNASSVDGGGGVGGGDLDAAIDRVVAAASAAPPGTRLHPVAFEKDDDTNFHMQLVAGLANARARNYGIAEVDRLKAKLIAGKIVPAIATATAAATGLVALELYKVVAGDKPVEAYRNTFANLALPLFAMAEPVPPKTFRHKKGGGGGGDDDGGGNGGGDGGDGEEEISWTLWDRWTLEGDLTLQEVLDWFSAKGLDAYSISCGQSLLYNSVFPRHRDRLGRRMRELAAEVAKVEGVDSLEPGIGRSHFDVVVACEDEEGEDLDVPLVSIKFK